MRNCWKKIERTLTRHKPEVFESLNPPATAQAIAAAEAELGVRFPEPLRASLAIHDGMHHWLHELWRPLPLSEIRETWREQVQMLSAGEFEGLGTAHDRKVQDGWFHRGWIPFAANDHGDLVCVDMAPGPRGKPGQVVIFWYDDDERKAEASSLLGWLRKVARELSKGPTQPRLGAVVIELEGATHAFRNPKAAQLCALKGQTELAVHALEAFWAQGDVSSLAALSVIHAFRAEWDRVLEQSPLVVGDQAFQQGNTLSEHLQLIARAGDRTGRWDRVREIAGALRGIRSDQQVDRLLASAEQGVDRLNTNPFLELQPAPEDQLVAKYQKYLEQGPPSHYATTPALRRRYHLSIAIRLRRWDVVRQLISESQAIDFRHILELSTVFPPELIWELILASLPTWREPYFAQVAPVSLLVTPGVREMMTPARCLAVLSQPRARSYWDYRVKRYR